MHARFADHRPEGGQAAGCANPFTVPAVTEHLHNAARVWEAMLAELHPEHQWVVSVHEDASAQRAAATTSRPGAPHRAAGDRPALDRRGERGLDQAA